MDSSMWFSNLDVGVSKCVTKFAYVRSVACVLAT